MNNQVTLRILRIDDPIDDPIDAPDQPGRRRSPGSPFLRTPFAGVVAPPATPPPPAEAVALPTPTDRRQVAGAWSGRVLALGLLGLTLGALGWAAQQVYYVVADAWIAPAHLSPSSDAVAQLRLAHQRQRSELARTDAEIARIDGELEAIDGAAARLSALRGGTAAALRWQAEHSKHEAAEADAAGVLIARQHALVGDLLTRQRRLVERARADLAAGLIDRTGVEREEQTLDQLAIERTELERQRAEARARSQRSRTALAALRASAGRGVAPTFGTMPEVAAGDEHDARIEVEIEQLRAEARGRRAQRAAALDSVAAYRALLAELEARPLYRAMTAATDIAFVPYDQLPGVHPGAHVMACTWGVFACHQVGVVSEVMPGEVVTQDPWGEIARGQYAILQLDAPDAIQHRVLRVRD